MSEARWAWRHLSATAPTLLHPPAGDTWWWVSSEEWAVVCDDVLLICRDRWVTVHDECSPGDVVHAAGGLMKRMPARFERRANRNIDPTDPLPFGATRARRLWRAPDGEARLWEDDFWLYRQPLGKQPAPVGRIAAEQDLIVGPRGALLLVEDSAICAAAAPGRPLVALAEPVETSWEGVRWAPSGEEVSIPGEPSTHLVLGTGRTQVAPDNAVCAGPESVLSSDRSRLRSPAGELRLDPLEAAHTGSHLVGPGAAYWDLASLDLTPLTLDIEEGILAVTGLGEVLWVDDSGPSTRWLRPPGRADVTLPLAAREHVVDAWGEPAAVALLTSLGRVLEVSASGVSVHDARTPPKAARAATPHQLVPFVASGSHLGQERGFAWTHDGLLLCWPL